MNEELKTSLEAGEIERLKEELRREHEMHLRALADFENFRRRAERERQSAARSGKRELMLPLLEVLDSFDRALEQVNDRISSVSEGLQAIQRKLLSLLEAQGITRLQTVGQPFYPELHEAVGSVKTDEFEPGTIADEVQAGYRWGDELLRPARVRVAQ